jgi:uncharacterized protein YecT (DUF1311 family)
MGFTQNIALAALCAIAVGQADAATQECIADAGNRLTVGGCMSQVLNRADVELNEIYQRLLNKAGTDTGPQIDNSRSWRRQLVEAQRAWVTFRDKECRAVRSALPQDPAIDSRNTLCLLEHTQRRVEQLQEWMRHREEFASHLDDSAFMDTREPVVGRPLDYWLQAYWRWARSFAPDKKPSADSSGSLCAVRQNQSVFFLTGSADSRHVSRECHLPRDKPVLVPVLNSLAQDTRNAADACLDVVIAAGKANRQARDLAASLDGQAIPSQQIREAGSGCFILDDSTQQLRGAAAGAGYWFMLAPLPPGLHTLKFSGAYDYDGFSQDVEYRLIVE